MVFIVLDMPKIAWMKLPIKVEVWGMNAKVTLPSSGNIPNSLNSCTPRAKSPAANNTSKILVILNVLYSGSFNKDVKRAADTSNAAAAPPVNPRKMSVGLEER